MVENKWAALANGFMGGYKFVEDQIENKRQRERQKVLDDRATTLFNEQQAALKEQLAQQDEAKGTQLYLAARAQFGNDKSKWDPRITQTIATHFQSAAARRGGQFNGDIDATAIATSPELQKDVKTDRLQTAGRAGLQEALDWDATGQQGAQAPQSPQAPQAPQGNRYAVRNVLESGRPDYSDTDPKTGQLLRNGNAVGGAQVLESTLKSPGYGITPWNGQVSDIRRVGDQYLDEAYRRFPNDPVMAHVAYNQGIDTVANAVQKYGQNWIQGIPEGQRANAQAYADKVTKLLSNGVPDAQQPSGPVAQAPVAQQPSGPVAQQPAAPAPAPVKPVSLKDAQAQHDSTVGYDENKVYNAQRDVTAARYNKSKQEKWAAVADPTNQSFNFFSANPADIRRNPEAHVLDYAKERGTIADGDRAKLDQHFEPVISKKIDELQGQLQQYNAYAADPKNAKTAVDERAVRDLQRNLRSLYETKREIATNRSASAAAGITEPQKPGPEVEQKLPPPPDPSNSVSPDQKQKDAQLLLQTNTRNENKPPERRTIPTHIIDAVERAYEGGYLTKEQRSHFLMTGTFQDVSNLREVKTDPNKAYIMTIKTGDGKEIKQYIPSNPAYARAAYSSELDYRKAVRAAEAKLAELNDKTITSLASDLAKSLGKETTPGSVWLSFERDTMSPDVQAMWRERGVDLTRGIRQVPQHQLAMMFDTFSKAFRQNFKKENATFGTGWMHNSTTLANEVGKVRTAPGAGPSRAETLQQLIDSDPNIGAQFAGLTPEEQQQARLLLQGAGAQGSMPQQLQ